VIAPSLTKGGAHKFSLRDHALRFFTIHELP
jgi:hypothetical protein